MDAETAEAIQGLTDRIDRLELSLRGEMASVRDGLRGEMAGMRDDLRGEMASMRDDLRGDMASVRDGLRGEMTSMREELRGEFRDGLAENRRHTEILFESLRDDIRLLADGVAHLAVKVDQLAR